MLKFLVGNLKRLSLLAGVRLRVRKSRERAAKMSAVLCKFLEIKQEQNLTSFEVIILFDFQAVPSSQASLESGSGSG